MRPFTRLSLTLSALVGLAACAAGQTSQPAAAPHIQVSPAEWSFGTLWHGQKAQQQFTIRNTGSAPLTIDTRSSCGCTTPSKPRSPLGPGEEDKLTIEFHANGKVGKAFHTVTLITNDPAQPETNIQVTGEVRPTWSLDPATGLTLGKCFAHQKATVTVTITNHLDQPLQLKLKPDQDFGKVAIELRELEAGQRYTITATTLPPLEIGTVRADVVLETGVSFEPELKLRVAGLAVPAVNVLPMQLLVPPDSNAPKQKTLYVSYAPDHPVKVLAVRASEPSIHVAFEALGDDRVAQARGQYQVIVTLPPVAELPRDKEITVEIETDAQDAEYRVLKVPVRIIGAGERAGRRPEDSERNPPTDNPPPASQPAKR